VRGWGPGPLWKAEGPAATFLTAAGLPASRSCSGKGGGKAKEPGGGEPRVACGDNAPIISNKAKTIK